MRLNTILSILIFLPVLGFGQNINNDNDSEVLTGENFDLKFLIKVLPDNGWILKLNKDSTYEYVHWSGFGRKEGYLIEKGKYKVTKNQLILNPNEKKTDLKARNFYLFTSNTTKLDNVIDCDKIESQIYCLKELK